MKKLAVFLLAAVLLLSACGGPQREDGGFPWPDNPPVEQKNESLTVYCMDVGKGSTMMERAAGQYRKRYPNVKVELIQESYNGGLGLEAYQQVAAEIMAGKGPDIILIEDTVMDVEKLVRQGVFADMEPYFAADGFEWAPYNQTIMRGGVWDGRRYVIPLSYDFPLLITSRAALEETGFHMEACGGYPGFLEETRRYLEDSAQTRALCSQPLLLTGVVRDSGLQLVDYNTQTVDLSAPELKEMLTWRKMVTQRYGLEVTGGADATMDGAAAVRDGEALWIRPFTAASGFYWEYGALKTLGEAVMMPIRDWNGGIQAEIENPVAVRANSENLQNAYDFLKILLSEDVQCGFASYYGGEELSVLNAANEDFYAHPSLTPGRWDSYPPGTNGFFSTMNEFESTDYPTEEEYREFMGYVDEISGTCYSGRLGFYGAMEPFLMEGADYDETIKTAKRRLELYLSE